MTRIILIDNYDSFTYNLVHYVMELGAEVEVVRNDASNAEDILASAPDGIIVSPGPATPNESGICLDLVKQNEGGVPLLGVCLGHQVIGQVYGGTIVRTHPMHGKTSSVLHNGEGVFKGLPSPFTATRYHSLIIERNTVPDCLHVTAETEDGIIMGIQHNELPYYGVQFHPESIASEYGHDLIQNFLKLL